MKHQKASEISLLFWMIEQLSLCSAFGAEAIHWLLRRGPRELFSIHDHRHLFDPSAGQGLAPRSPELIDDLYKLLLKFGDRVENPALLLYAAEARPTDPSLHAYDYAVCGEEVIVIVRLDGVTGESIFAPINRFGAAWCTVGILADIGPRSRYSNPSTFDRAQIKRWMEKAILLYTGICDGEDFLLALDS